MSKVIDERVVSMQFDNKHFESNVQTTMSTLDKLKAKLKFTDAGKGLEGLEKSASRCNLSPLSNAVDNVGLKFNAMYTIADQALRNITNSAMAAGKKIVSALTIDPVKTGLSEYETKINSVQVIKSNTRGKFDSEEEQMETIYSALDRLNEYADRTIYNYTQMTDNVGKFVAQTGDINKSVKAVEGLANLAGASGASASDMARATYQMSQALGGTIRKIDWNSLRNANMATLELKNMLIELGKVKGIDIDSMIKNKGTFEDTLEEGWLTGDLFLEAMNIYSDAYSEAELAAMGFGQEQIKNFKALAEEARAATTEVKTISQLWDVLKETAQSGWTKTWELIIGDFDSAKALLSPLAEFFMGFINKMSDARNNLLEGALNLASPWKTLTEKLNGTGLENIKKVADSIVDMTDKLTHFQDIVNDVWRGDYATSDTGRYEMLEAAGYDHRVVQDLVNLGYQYEITVEDIEASHKKFGLTLDKNSESAKKTADALANLSEEQLREAGLTEAEIKLYKDLQAESERTGKSIDDLAGVMSRISGRTLLINSFKNIGKSLVTIFSSIGKAWSEIFPPMSVVRLYNIIKSFNDFTKKLKISEGTAEKLTRVFKGLFAVLDIIGTVVGGGVRLAFKAVSKVLDLFGMSALDAAASIGDMLVAVRDWIDEHSLLNTVIDKFGPAIKDAVKSVKKWFNETKPIAKVLESLAKIFDKISACVLDWANGLWNSIPAIMDWIAGIGEVENISDYIANGITSGIKVVVDAVAELARSAISKIKEFFGGGSSAAEFVTIGTYIVQGLVKGLIAGGKIIWDTMIELGKSLISIFSDTVGVQSPSVVFFAIGTFIILGLVGGLLAGGQKVWDAIRSVATKAIDAIKSVNFKKLFEKPIKAISSFKDAVLDKLGPVGDALSGFAKKVKDFVTGLNIGFGEIVTILVGGGMIFALIKFASTFGKVVGILTNISDAFAGIGESISGAFKKIGNAALLIGLAVAIGLLAKAFIELSKLSWKEFAVGIAALGSIAGVLIILSAAFGLMSKFSMEITAGAGALIAIAVSIGILAYALQMVTQIKSDNLLRDVLVLGGIGVALVGVTALLSKLAPEISKGSFTMIAIAGAILLLVYAVSKIEALTISDPAKLVTVFIGLIAGLALVSRLAKGLNFGSAVGILAMVGAILLFTHAINRLADMKLAKIKANIGEIALILGMLAAVMLASRLAGGNAGKAGFALLAISAALILVGVAIRTLASISPSDMTKGTEVIVKILAMFALLTVASAIAGKNAAKAGLMLMEMSAALLLISGSIFILSKIAQTNESGLQAASDCILKLMGMFALIILASGVAKSAMGTIITIGIVLGLLTVAIGALSMIPRETLTTATGCLAGIMAMMAILIAVTALINTTGAAFLKVSAVLIVMAAVVYVLGMVIAQIAALEPQNALAATQALSTLLLSLSAACAIVAVAGMVGIPAALTGIGAFVVFIAAVAGVMWAIQALVDDAESVSAGLDVAIMVLEKIGNGIGSFAGGIIGGLGAGIFSGLEAMAEDLNDFMTTLTKEGGFIEGAKSIDDAAITGVKNIIGLLTIFAGAELLEKIGSKFFGESDLTVFGEKLVSFGNSLVSFRDSISSLTDDDLAKINTSAQAAKALTNMADSVPNMGGKLAEFFGENDLSVFGEKLVSFGESLVIYGESIRNLTEDDIEKINTSADAAMALTAMADSVPNMGGKLAEFFGENDLSVFGEKLASFGGSLVTYSESIRSLTKKDIDLINMSADAGMALGDMASAVPNMGGLLADFFGENDLSDFGEELVSFGENLVGYAESIRGLTKEDASLINMSADAAIALANMADKVPNMGGLLANIVGENSITAFADDLEGFGTSILNYAKSVIGIDDSHVKYIKKSGEAVEALATVAKKVPNEGGWLGAIAGENNVDGFADGMTSLGYCINRYSSAVSGITDATVATIITSKDAVEALASVAKVIPNEGGLFGAFAGENDLAGFTTDMIALGNCINSYVAVVSGIDDIKIDAIKNSKTALTEMTAAAKALPNEGGLAGLLAGENTNVTGFANNMSILGKSINDYIAIISGIDDTKVDAIKMSKTAIVAMTDAAKALPNEGGVAGFFAGENSSATGFAANMVALGNCINSYVAIISGIDDTKIDAIRKSKTAITEMTAAAKALPNEGGVAGFFAGENTDATSFVNNMVAIGNCINKYVSVVSGIDDTKIDSIKNSKDAVEQMAKVAKQVPKLGEDSITNVSTLSTTMPSLGTAIRNYAANISSIGEDDVKAAKQAVKVIEQFKDAVGKLSKLVIGATESKVDSAIATIKKVLNFAADVKSSDSNGLSSLADNLKSAAKDGVDAFIKAFTDSHASVRQAGRNLVMKFADGIPDRTYYVKQKIADLLTDVNTALSGGTTSAYNSGKNIATSFANGIADYSYKAINQANSLATSVTNIVNKALGINSPSKVFTGIGGYVVEGFANGIQNGVSTVRSASEDMAKTSCDAVNGAISILGSIASIDLGIECEPVIAPVVDMTNVESSANAMTALFGNINPTTSIAAEVSGISANMNAMERNGGSDDIVSAINKLSEKLENLETGDTYSINGITYDDGSNIANAMNSIVRACRLQGRS